MSAPAAAFEYINWYFDQAGAWIGFTTALILLIIYSKTLNDQNTTKSLKEWIYSLCFSHLFLAISGCAQVSLLPILKSLNISIDQAITCKIITIHMGAFVAWYHISVFNIFMEQIYGTCKGSVFEFNKLQFIVIRSIHSIIWLIIAITSAFITDPSPNNAWNTCSTFTYAKINTNTIIFLISIALIILGGYIFAWRVFVYQFTRIIKFTTNNKSASKNKTNEDFYQIIREQTLIISLQVSSTFIFYVIQMTGFFGQLSVTLDFVLTPIIIFLGFKCNRYYFELLKCDKLAISCCSKFEKRILAQVSGEKTRRNITVRSSTELPEEHPTINNAPSRSTTSTHSIPTGCATTIVTEAVTGQDLDNEISLTDIEMFDIGEQVEIDNALSIEVVQGN